MIDLQRPQRIHVIGVGGAGMSAIATVLQAMGHSVSGSDQRDSAALARVAAAGVVTKVGHDRDEVADADLVTISTAINDTNPALVAARAAGKTVYRRAEMLAAISAQRSTIAVAGTHGKTTTSSMLSLILVEAGWKPSFIIGGEINEIGGNAVWDTGEWFVVEADESDGTFLELPRKAAVINNVAPDHLDHYGGYDQLRDAFARFARETDGPVVVSDAPDLAELVNDSQNVVTVGLDPASRYVIDHLERERASVRFELRRGGDFVGRYRVPTPGEHNARNAAVAAVMALELGVAVKATQSALERFAGVARRFQFRGTQRGVDYVEDYAHLPDEVAVAIAAARDGAWDRVVVVFQPHRYSRTQQLATDFAHAFDGADHVIITDIYGAGEAPRPGVTGHLVVDAVRAANPSLGVTWLRGRADLAAHLAGAMRPGELCLLLSAGDLTSVPDEVAAVP
ncbi:MAG TPA: UDP-N-acetylmuramate--L-alanine ligase [Acidimicrobiales bacterium]|nr:UDP-N-acetylmuramate--L-alanine ligase [Acidimicrobiales bacterium]